MDINSLSDEEYFKLLDMMDMLKQKYPEKVKGLTDEQIMIRLYNRKKPT